MKRLIVTLAILAALTVGAAYACNPAVSVGTASYGHRVGVSVGYAQPTYSVSVVSPYTPVVSLPATYAVQAPVVAAAPCVCEQPQVAAPAAYEAPVAAPVAAPAVRYAAPVAAATYVAAPQVSYATVSVPVAGANYGYANVGVSRHIAVGVANVYSGVRVGVAAVRARPTVTVVRAKGGRVGLRERIQVRRAAVRAARAAR